MQIDSNSNLAASSTEVASSSSSKPTYSIHNSLSRRIEVVNAQARITDLYAKKMLQQDSLLYSALVHASSRRIEWNERTEQLKGVEGRNLSFLFVSKEDRGQCWDPTLKGAKFTNASLEDDLDTCKNYEEGLNAFLDRAFAADLPFLIQLKKTTLRQLWDSFAKTRFALCNSKYSPDEYGRVDSGMGRWKNMWLSPNEMNSIPSITFEELGVTDRYLDQPIQTKEDAEAFFELAVACSRKHIIQSLCEMQETESEELSEWVDLPDGIQTLHTRPSLEGFSDLYPLQGLDQTQQPARKVDCEGVKVRTFSLELLSNIEDLQNSLGDSSFFSLLKEALKHFLENGAHDARAGFTDFLKLIKVLKGQVHKFENPAAAEKLMQQLERHTELVALQKDLRPKSPASRWAMIRTLVHSGLLRGNGEHLWPMPAVPDQQTLVHAYPMLDAINLLASSYREAGRWVMHHTQILSFKELCQSIKESCEKLQETILSWDQYYLIGVRDKSQEWMTKIAGRYLPARHMPRGLLISTHATPFPLYYFQNGGNFMMFDDCGYSCQQLTTYLQSLLQELKTAGTPLSKPVNLCIIYGFLPDNQHPDGQNWQNFFHEFTKYNLHIELVTSRIIPTCQTLMEREKVHADLQQQIKKITNPKIPLLATEWKTPDFFSLSTFVTEGYIPPYLRRADHQELDTPIDHVKMLDGMGPMPEIVSPYKRVQRPERSFESAPAASSSSELPPAAPAPARTPPPSDPPKIHPCMKFLYWLVYIFTFSFLDLFPKKSN